MAPKPKGPLDRRLAATAGKEETSHWNISELKQNLQEDSAMLEQTLREANKLLGDSAGVPLVDVGGVVNKDAIGQKKGDASEADEGKVVAVSGTFMTELDISAVSNVPSVTPTGSKMSEELALRLAVLEDVIGQEALQVLKSTVQSDIDQVARLSRAVAASSAARTGDESSVEELEARIIEEEALKLAAQESNRVLQENLRLQSTKLAELQEKLALLDSTSQEGGELLRKKESEMKGLKEELVAAQHKTRVEEAERLKLVDKLRKKEVEMSKSKETMDKMTMQLQRLGEERDHMHVQLEDTKSRCSDLQYRCNGLEEELNKLQSAERVLKRNLQLQLPDEIKRVVKRMEDMEKQNRELQTKLEKHKENPDVAQQIKAAQVETMELKVANKTLQQRLDNERKEKEALEKKSVAERRLLENRTKSLFDKSVRSSQKLQGETDLRIAERLHNRSSDNEVATLRRRNLELLGQLNSLDEAKAKAERTSQDHLRKCKDLQEKLELYATIHRINISEMGTKVNLNTEDEMSVLLNTRHGGMGNRNSRSATPASGTRSSKLDLSMTKEPVRPASTTPTTNPAAMTPGEQARSSARAEVNGEDPEALRHKLMMTQSRLAAEEKGKASAQEKVVALAEQMLEKDREIQALKNAMDLEKDNKRRRKKNNRVRDLEAQVMSLITKLREAEMDKDQIEHKLNEKEEEGRIKARKISELIFKLQVEEEAKARVQEESSELVKQLARHTQTAEGDKSKLEKSGSANPANPGSSPVGAAQDPLKEPGTSAAKEAGAEGAAASEAGEQAAT